MLGAVLLVIILMFVACSGGNNSKDQRNAQGKGAGSVTTTTPTPTVDDTSFAPAAPGGGSPSLPAPGDITSQQPTLGDGGNASSGNTGSNSQVTAGNGAVCADSEISAVPTPSVTTMARGTTITVRLTIKNISNRTCSRDVGADPQELYVDEGANKIWSSDNCGTSHGSDVRQFTPGAERQFSVTWNGRESTTCAAAQAAGPAPVAGQYALRLRVGTKLSDPVTLTIT